MATAADIEADLTLEIGGHAVTPEKFLKGVRSFFAILTEVTKSVGKPSAAAWHVQVKHGSNLVGLSPQPGFDPAVAAVIIDAVSAGIEMLEDVSAHPPYFSDRAIRNLRDLGGIVGRTDTDDTTVRVWARKKPLAVSYGSVANVNALLANEHVDHGSIEGRLQTVTERGRLQFVVYDPLWDEPIRCFIPEEQVDEAMAAFRARVAVYGMVHYRRDGRPTSIDVEEIVVFPPHEKLPGFKDVHGILRQAS